MLADVANDILLGLVGLKSAFRAAACLLCVSLALLRSLGSLIAKFINRISLYRFVVCI